MRLFSILFLAGCCFILWMPFMIDWRILLLCCVFLSGIYFYYPKKSILFFLGIISGLTWSMMFAQYHLDHRLPKRLENKYLNVSGQIVSLPKYSDHSVSFIFKTPSIFQDKKNILIKLTWYDKQKNIEAGDQWVLTVKLKQPRGFLNPGGFDEAAYLFQNNIGAVGYVINRAKNYRIIQASSPFSILVLRQHLSDRLSKMFSTDDLYGFLQALIVGSRNNIRSSQWTVLRNTGTNHLIAIAGLHISIIAAAVFFLIQFLWKRFPRLCLYIPAQQIAAYFSLSAAFFYSLLSGFSIQTERACIMLMVILSALFLVKRKIGLWQSWFLSLFIVLLMNPLDVMNMGFWMSFISVASIIYGMQSGWMKKNIWNQLGKIQWVIMLGILPLSFAFFGEASMMSFIANIIAVPWFTFIIVPVTFFGGLISFISLKLSYLLLWFVLKNLHLLWYALNFLSNVKIALFQPVGFHFLEFIFLSIAVFLLISPKGFPYKYLAFFFCLPALFPRCDHPKKNHVWLTVLDVGQGLSCVIQTEHHVLIYDTGPSYGDDSDAGQVVILPFLKTAGIHRIDTLVVSHGDNDHIGGSFSLLKSVPVNNILTSVPERFFQYKNKTDFCHKGQTLQWDGVTFKMIWPYKKQYLFGNNGSCVLSVNDGGQTILLPGDIEKEVEKKLLKEQIDPVSILIAPHHGSKTSSSVDFIKKINPKNVIYSTGYLNHFHFPNERIVVRYLKLGTKQFNTVDGGAITFDIEGGMLKNPKQYRLKHARVWL